MALRGEPPMTDAEKHIVDVLIEERAPHLAQGPSWPVVRPALYRALHYKEARRMADDIASMSGADALDHISKLLSVRLDVRGAERIPSNGRCVIVANHPTGIADGIVLNAVISAVRDDLFVYANHDILRIMPQFESLIAPVEWRVEKRSHAKTRATMDYTRTALERGRIGLIFPSGRLAKRRGLQLDERPWMASAAMIARKFDVPVIPLRIRARNSALFYLLDAIHPTLRDVTLFNEVLNKAGQPFRVTIGAPIAPTSLPGRSEDGIAALRDSVLALPAPGEQAARLPQLRRLSQGRHALVKTRPID